MTTTKFKLEEVVAAFRRAACADGIELPENVVADGKLHRIAAAGRARGKDDYYVLHLDGIPGGAYGSFLLGVKSRWSARNLCCLTSEESSRHAAEMAIAHAQRVADIAALQRCAAQEANVLWKQAPEVTLGHPYLDAKGVKAFGLRLGKDGGLLVPMRDSAGVLHNVEHISRRDFKLKRGLKHGRRTGLFHAIGKPGCRVILCEGYATGASIHEATGEQVVVCFNAANLPQVAVALRAEYPRKEFTLAADDDWQVQGHNPGLDCAQRAAAKVQGYWTVPRFGPDRGLRDTDFNDMHQALGLIAVRTAFTNIWGS